MNRDDMMLSGGPYSYRSKPRSRTPNKLGEFGKCVKYMMFVFNVIIFFLGLGVVGVGIWLAVDQNHMTNIIGTHLFAASLFVMLAGGGMIVFIAFLGFVGAVTENRLMIGLYMFFLILIAALLLIAGILGFVFRTQLHEQVRSFMTETLTNSYGVNLYEGWNRGITWSWDKTQERLHCCAVDDQSWALYQASNWYKEQPGIPGWQIKPFVPASCCKLAEYGDQKYKDEKLCRTLNIGPPAERQGMYNPALYYKGCYNRGRDWLIYKSGFMIGIGMAIAIFLIGGILCSAYLFFKLRKTDNGK